MKSPGPARAATADKKNARAVCESLVRQANAFAQANPAVTAAQKAAAGLPVPRPRRRAIAAPETRPVLTRVDNTPLLHVLWFADERHPASHAKPAGVGSCEIRLALAAPDVPSPDDPVAMPFLAAATSSPFRHAFHLADSGRAAFYALRWLNPTGQPGPWGTVTRVVVT